MVELALARCMLTLNMRLAEVYYEKDPFDCVLLSECNHLAKNGI